MSSISHRVPDPLRSTSSGGMGMMVDSLGVRGGKLDVWVLNMGLHESGMGMMEDSLQVRGGEEGYELRAGEEQHMIDSARSASTRLGCRVAVARSQQRQHRQPPVLTRI